MDEKKSIVIFGTGWKFDIYLVRNTQLMFQLDFLTGV